MKKGLVVGACFLFILIVLMSFASAGFFSDFWGKITGKVTYDSRGWTEWLNRDGPSGSGDYETKVNFVGICDTPTGVECRVIVTKVSYDETGQVVAATPNAGCYCLNSNNPEGCLDYEVRFLCPDMATSSYCGDGTCDADETCTNCPGDCGECETSSTCESGVYSYPQDKDSPSNNILHYALWGNDYKYAKGYCSIVRGCAGYKDVTTEVDSTVVCRCDTGSFGCVGGSCTTSGYSSFVTITSVTCVECDEDVDCGEGNTCQNDICVQLKENGIICSLSGQKRCYSDLYFQVPTGSTNCNDLSESVRNTMCGTKCPSIACNGDVSPLCDGGTSVYNTRSSSCGSSPYYHVDCRCFADGTYQEEILYTSCIKDSDCGEGNTCQNDICVQLKENGATCSLDFECKSGSCGETLAGGGRRTLESVCHENPNKCVIDSSGIEVNDGRKSCLTSKIFRTCFADPNEAGNSWGAQTPCASDETCFEGRGCLKHEFIFRLDDGHFPADKYVFNVENPLELEDAMELSDSCVGVSFRINKMPPDESDLDDFVSEMEARGYYYYITAGSSDFRTWAGFPITNAESPFILDIPKLCGYLKNEHAEGLYLHEMGRYVAGAYNDKVYDWENIEQVLACAKANKKKVIWSDFGSGGWTDVRYYIDNDNEARRIFETYGDVLVPLIADNTRTDEAWRKDLPGGLSFEDIIHVSDEYCNGERGGSIQDWHWEAITGSLDVPALDIERYIGISYDEGGKYSQFEDSNWDKNEPQNHGEFYMGIQKGKTYICGVSPCIFSDCDPSFTCENPKCIGSYDTKINQYGDPVDWTANTYHGQLCERCNNAGNKGYAIHDLAWYEHTCVQNKFLWCWGVRWSQGKTYVANAYRAVSCEGLSEPNCNSHSGCNWGSFSCN